MTDTPQVSMQALLEAGAHFGHQTHRWNPRMAPYIYGDRNGIHILDLTQTVPLLDQALAAVQATVAKGGRILFVGTKRQAQKAVADAAERSAQYYMNHRWLGGTLTNWKTVSNSIARLKAIEADIPLLEVAETQSRNRLAVLLGLFTAWLLHRLPLLRRAALVALVALGTAVPSGGNCWSTPRTWRRFPPRRRRTIEPSMSFPSRLPTSCSPRAQRAGPRA